MKRICLGLFAAALLPFAAAQSFPVSQPPIWSGNPGPADFDRIEYGRIAGARASIDALLAVKGARSVDNTLAPYDEAVRQLNAALYLSDLVLKTNPDKLFRDQASAMNSRVAGVQSALNLNRGVFQALAGLDLSKADAATAYYVKRQLLEFRLAGVDKDDATRERLKKLSERLAEDQSLFERNIADSVITVDLPGAAALDGLPADFVRAHAPGADGKVHVTTNYPDLFPVLNFAKSAATRRDLWSAYARRAYPANIDVLKDMMQLRDEIARTMGYASFSGYFAADKMIGSAANIEAFIAELDATTRPVAQREFALLLAERRKTEPQAKQIESYDTFYYEELVRRSQFAFDSQSIRPYLPYEQVKKGIMSTAAALFHVEFRQEIGAPGWAPGVETWDVFEGGKAIGRFYLDVHPRPGKFSHAEMSAVLDGIKGRQLPEAVLNCNFPGPTADDPGLMDFESVVTFFHEFGHLMHHILGGAQRWAGISGITMESDFVEAPSEMLEEWMHSPQVLAGFARHYQTGAPIPAELVARMNRASAFGRATSVARQNALTAISYRVYRGKPADVPLDTLGSEMFRTYTLITPSEGSDRFVASFGHLANYASSYYTYMYDKVIAEDFFWRFDRTNLLAGEAPMRYRRLVLDPGGSMPAADLVRNFLGRPQKMEAFQRWMQEEFADADK